jgi:hypothetical protein
MIKEELIQQLSKYNFDKTNVELAIRADFKCEYCDKDLLANMDAYKLWQVDHIIPQFLGLDNREDFNNKALTCVQCNKDLKGKWNPSENIVIEANRENYIFLIRKYIEENRNAKNLEVDQIRAIVSDFRRNNK